MDREARGDPAELIAGVGRHWGWVLAFGIVTLVAGLLVLLWPGRTLVVVAVLLGIELMAAGIFRFVGALAADDESGAERALLALLGVLSFIVGLYALRRVVLTLAVLALLLGIYFVVNGAVGVFTALSRSGMRARGWVIVEGVLSVIAGVVFLVFPADSLLVLAVVLGVWLLLWGLIEVVVAFRLRSAGPAAT